MTDVSISVSVLNIVVCSAIIVGCIYVICRLIKKCRSLKQIKNSQGKFIGYKKSGSKLKTLFFVLFLITIIIFAGFIGTMHIFNIILIS